MVRPTVRRSGAASVVANGKEYPVEDLVALPVLREEQVVLVGDLATGSVSDGHGRSSADLLTWIRDIQITADLSGEEVIKLSMAGNRSILASFAVGVDAVARALAEKLAALRFEMLY